MHVCVCVRVVSVDWSAWSGVRQTTVVLPRKS